jgi:hypothetical protein
MQMHARDKELAAAAAAAAAEAAAAAAAAEAEGEDGGHPSSSSSAAAASASDLRLAARGSPAIGGGASGSGGALRRLGGGGGGTAARRGAGATVAAASDGGDGDGNGDDSGGALAAAGGGGGGDDGGEPGLDVKQLNGELLGLLEAVFEFLAGLRDDGDMLAAVTTHAKFFAMAVHAADCGGVEAGDVLGHFEDMRATILRLHVIKRTDFIPSGYSLMELLVWVTMALTCLGQFDGNTVAAYATVTMSALQFFYVIALMRDIDDPFDYEPETLFPSVEVDGEAEGGEEEKGGGGGEGDEGPEPPNRCVTMQGIGSSAEIDQFPLIDVYARLARAAGLKMGRAAPPSVRDEQGRLVPPSVALAGLGGARKAAKRLDYSLRLRARMVAAWNECDDGPAVEEGEVAGAEIETKKGI